MKCTEMSPNRDGPKLFCKTRSVKAIPSPYAFYFLSRFEKQTMRIKFQIVTTKRKNNRVKNELYEPAALILARNSNFTL